MTRSQTQNTAKRRNSPMFKRINWGLWADPAIIDAEDREDDVTSIMAEFVLAATSRVQSSTEDDAIQTVNFFDAMAVQNMRDLDEFETKLVAEIEAKTNALKAVREAKERGKALLPIDPALKGLEQGYDPADDSRKSYEAAIEAKRKRGDKHFRRPVAEAAE